jgi:hypothetical protein
MQRTKLARNSLVECDVARRRKGLSGFGKNPGLFPMGPSAKLYMLDAEEIVPSGGRSAVISGFQFFLCS